MADGDSGMAVDAEDSMFRSSLADPAYDASELDAFADSLSHAREASRSPFDAIQQYGDIVSRRALALGESASSDAEMEAYEESMLESRLWVLVHSLYGLRTHPAAKPVKVKAYSSDAVVQEMYARRHKKVRERWLLEGWLQDGMPVPEEPAEYRVSKWMYTKNQVRHGSGGFGGSGSGSTGGGLFSFGKGSSNQLGQKSNNSAATDSVSQLDPDAPLRQNKKIAPEDDKADRVVFRYVFELLLNRKYDEAVAVAGNTGNWALRLALRGSDTYIDPEIDGRDLGLESEAERPHGVERKPLWRRTCWELARTAADPYERGVYGFLSGELESVLALCHTWESQFLAYLNHIVHGEAETALAEAGRLGSKETGDMTLAGAGQITSVRKVLDVLAESADPAVRAASQHPLRIIMGAIINDAVPTLVDSSAADIQAALDGSGADDVALTATLLRVLTHLVLFLNQLGVPTGQPKSLAVIVRAYILLLRDSGLAAQVPVYISYLPPDVARDVYSDLLAQATDPNERRKHLELGRRYRLAMDDTIRATVRQVFGEVAARQPLPATGGVLAVDAAVTPDDAFLCRAVEWPIEAGLWRDAVDALIGFFRHVLWRGRIGAALALAQRVDVSTILKKHDASPKSVEAVPPARRAELLAYDKLASTLKAMDTWASRPTTTATAKGSSPFEALQAACNHVYDISETWLLDIPSDASPADEALEPADCAYIRSVYVPYLLLALVDILADAGSLSRGYYRQAVDVSVLVADERLQLYKLFDQGGHLPTFLSKIASCATEAVAIGEQGLWTV